MQSAMDNSGKDTDTTATALQSTSVAATRPKLIIGSTFVMVVIVILLEIYAPRQKADVPGVSIQKDTSTMPAEIESSGNDMADENP
jgi:hypothetical protein